MFGLFAKKDDSGKEVKFKIEGMHCSGCAVDIDLTLEEVVGIKESKTSFAKAETVIRYNPELIDIDKIEKEVNKTGYKIVK